MANRKVALPLQTRLAPLSTFNADTRTVNVVWSRGARVVRARITEDWDFERYIEELDMSREAVNLERLNSGAPVLDTHQRYELRNVVGVVERASIENGEGIATIRFSEREDVAPLVKDVQDGIVRNISIGYSVEKYERAGNDPETGFPVYVARAWTPCEISLVPVAADPGAGVRSDGSSGAPAAPAAAYPCELIDNTIPADPATQRKETSMTPEELAAQKAAAEQKERDERERAEATRKAADAAATLERQRVTGIRALCKAHGMTREFEDALIGAEDKPGKSLEEARAAVLDELAKKTDETPIRSGFGDVVTISDETVNRRAYAVNALMHRANPGAVKLEEGARQFAGYTLREMARLMLEQRGVRTAGMSINQICERTFQGGSDLPNIVLDAANKSLRMAYDASPRTFVPWCSRGTAPDFKNINRIQLSGAPSLLHVQSGGEFKRGTVSDGKETYALLTYGRILGINRQTIINDDMGAFTRLPALAARAAADLESDTVYGIVTANGTLQTTGFNLFGTGHSNLGTGAATGTINVTQLSVARAKMRVQTGLEGRILNLQPRFLIVPAAKEAEADQFTSSAYVASASGNINPFAQSGRMPLTPIAEGRLDSNSTAAWYLAADPGQVDTIEYSYLEGQEGVYLESRMGWDVDGMELKVRHDFAAKALDYRGLVKMQGT